MSIKREIIIIGGGPIGLTCAIEAEKRGYSYRIIEKGALVNSIYHYPTNMTFFSTSERLEIGEVPFVSHGDKPTRREALEYYRRVKDAWNLNINLYEKVEQVEGEEGNFTVITDKKSYNCRYVIIATGFYDKPNLMNVPGEELPKVKHYFDEAHPYSWQKIIVVGGGNSAVDVALETFRRGAEVTMVLREEKLKESIKYWVKPDIENRIKEGSIKFFSNSTVQEIREKEVVIKTPGGVITLENDFLLAMTGYHTDFEFLKICGIAITETAGKIPLFNPETFETNKEGVYMAGVVLCGFDTAKWFIENSRYHAKNIFDNIQQKEENNVRNSTGV
jgi:thioredoxin reductase (NADPH)